MLAAFNRGNKQLLPSLGLSSAGDDSVVVSKLLGQKGDRYNVSIASTKQPGTAWQFAPIVSHYTVVL